jgi:hypothetical protein
MCFSEICEGRFPFDRAKMGKLRLRKIGQFIRKNNKLISACNACVVVYYCFAGSADIQGVQSKSTTL